MNFKLFGSSGLYLPTPRRVNGLQGWYKAKNTPLGAVAEWRDLSGKNNHAVQGTGSAQPTNTATQINGGPALVFDGGDHLILPSGLYSLANGDNTTFVVGRRTTETGLTTTLFSFSEGGNTTTEARMYSVFASGAGTINFRSGTALSPVTTFSGATSTNFQKIRTRRSGTAQNITVNNGIEATTANGVSESGVDRGFIGAVGGSSLLLIGAIAEILFYNRSLDSFETAKIENYLSLEYGI
jgi:hypothetical protein